ncbi:hypothetical protein C0993_005874, partial [Termitomyces sp. T159_Od127]
MDPTLLQLALAAAGAGMATSFLLTPMKLVKCKMQVQMLVVHLTTALPSLLAILASVMRSAGVRGLWLGHTGMLIGETGGTAMWFMTKEFVVCILLARCTGGINVEAE